MLQWFTNNTNPKLKKVVKQKMCGIVACLRYQPAVDFLMAGLKEMEYRGYDSAGLAVLDDQGRPQVVKAVGDVDRLVAKVNQRTIKGQLGIGHTRWATHGRVSQQNAHPHTDDHQQFLLVHNGIIENYQSIKDFLIKAGHKFSSTTDSEVIAQLLAYNYRQQTDFRAALVATLKTLDGAYAVAIISPLLPGKLWAAKVSSPLLIGLDKKQRHFFIASDQLALADYATRMVVLADYEVAEIDSKGYKIFNLNRQTVIKRSPELLSLTPAGTKLVGFADFMSQEIAQSAQTVTNASLGRLKPDSRLVKLGGLDSVADRLKQIDRLIIVACGTSYYAGLVGERLFEAISDLPVEVHLASEFRYQQQPLSRQAALLAISQSGETADTLGALEKVIGSGMLRLGIVNVVGSSLARLTDAGIYCRAGVEKSVASTKAFIAQVTVLALMALYLSDQYPAYQKVLEALAKIPAQIDSLLAQQPTIAAIARKYCSVSSCLFLGRNYNYPVALEGALKLKEISYIHAEGLAAGEVKHGSLALVDDQFLGVVIAPENSVYQKTCSNLAEIKTRLGRTIVITDQTKGQASQLADDLIIIPKTVEPLQPLLTGVACHMLAYQMAKALGRPIDKPRNLAKSVTVE